VRGEHITCGVGKVGRARKGGACGFVQGVDSVRLARLLRWFSNRFLRDWPMELKHDHSLVSNVL
jgi:hypothetical protein